MLHVAADHFFPAQGVNPLPALTDVLEDEACALVACLVDRHARGHTVEQLAETPLAFAQFGLGPLPLRDVGQHRDNAGSDAVRAANPAGGEADVNQCTVFPSALHLEVGNGRAGNDALEQGVEFRLASGRDEPWYPADRFGRGPAEDVFGRLIPGYDAALGIER